MSQYNNKSNQTKWLLCLIESYVTEIPPYFLNWRIISIYRELNYQPLIIFITLRFFFRHISLSPHIFFAIWSPLPENSRSSNSLPLLKLITPLPAELSLITACPARRRGHAAEPQHEAPTRSRDLVPGLSLREGRDSSISSGRLLHRLAHREDFPGKTFFSIHTQGQQRAFQNFQDAHIFEFSSPFKQFTLYNVSNLFSPLGSL